MLLILSMEGTPALFSPHAILEQPGKGDFQAHPVLIPMLQKQLQHLPSSEPGFSAVLQWGSLNSEQQLVHGRAHSPFPKPGVPWMGFCQGSSTMAVASRGIQLHPPA